MATILPNSFSPLSISGCTLWLDGADRSTITSSAGSVSAWRDKSTNAYTVSTATGTVSLVSSTPSYLSFAAGAIMTGPSISFGGSIFIVFQATQNSVGNLGMVFGLSGGDKSVRYGSDFKLNVPGDGNDIGQNGAYIVNGTQVTISNPALNTQIFIIYTPVVNGFNGVFSISNTFMSRFFIGNMYEILIYNSSLTTVQRQQVEGYLAWKWGLQTSLPSNQPYRNAPPTSTGLALTLSAPLSLPMNSFQQTSLPFIFFNPTSIGNCFLWLDGSDPNGNGSAPANGTVLTSWRNKSASNIAFTVTGSPTYSARAINFTGSQAFVNSGISLNLSSMTVFLVGYNGAGANDSGFLGLVPILNGVDFNQSNAISYNCKTTLGTITVTYNFSATSINQTQTISSTPFMFEHVQNGTSMTLLANGSSYYTTTLGSSPGTTTGIAIGVRYQNGNGSQSAFYTGTINEILIYSSALSTTQRQQIEGYLAWKWNIQSSLPANHPYKSVVPVNPALSISPITVLQSASFRPSQISGLQLWLDGQDPNGNGTVPANGVSISTWTDKSGAGNNATGGTAVTYNTTGISNYPVMSFAGTPSFFSSTDLYSNRSFSVYIVSRRQAANSSSQSLIGGTTLANNQNMIILFTSATNLRFAFFNNDLDATIPAYTGNTATEPAFIFAFTYTPGSRNISVNGTVSASDTNTTNLIASLGQRIGAWTSTPASFAYTGFIGEILVYNGVPTTAQRQNIEGYLAWKWNLVSNLPATHPYKKFPPPPN